MDISVIQKVSVLNDTQKHKKLLILSLDKTDDLFLTITKENEKWFPESVSHHFSPGKECPFCKETPFIADYCTKLEKEIEKLFHSLLKDTRFRLRLLFELNHQNT